MPELPEVETVVRGLRPLVTGQTIAGMGCTWARTLHSPDATTFAARVAGQTIQAVNRRAKYIVMALDHDFLVVHLKMTGRLYVTAADAIHDADRWLRLHLDLDSGQQLRFSDPRKFGRVYLTSDLTTITGALGPEPLADDFGPADFMARLAGRKRHLKALLLDQGFIAGVGNIYADEALFRAGLHPLRRADSLTADEAERLYHTIRAALADGIAHEGASINWYRKPDGTRGESQDHFFVYGRGGQPCRRCGHPIEKIRVAQRGTHFCRACQPEHL